MSTCTVPPQSVSYSFTAPAPRYLDELAEFTTRYNLLVGKQLSLEAVKKRLFVLHAKGRLLVYWDDRKIVGYGETWRVTQSQLGRIVQGLPFDIGEEDIEHGEYCVVANCAIHPDYRSGAVLKSLRNSFLSQNSDAKYFCGMAFRKPGAPFKIFEVSKLKESKHGG